MLRLPNVATPPTAVTVVVPVRVPLPGLRTRETVTLSEKVVTGLPLTSSACTTTTGEMIAPAGVVCALTLNPSEPATAGGPDVVAAFPHVQTRDGKSSTRLLRRVRCNDMGSARIGTFHARQVQESPTETVALSKHCFVACPERVGSTQQTVGELLRSVALLAVCGVHYRTTCSSTSARSDASSSSRYPAGSWGARSRRRCRASRPAPI